MTSTLPLGCIESITISPSFYISRFYLQALAHIYEHHTAFSTTIVAEIKILDV